ncbi:MAG: holo-ACP synthase [Patescibacteria group bacterium]
MTIKIGSDIVYIPRFEKILRRNKEYFREHVFLPEELEYAKVRRLAGIFASKEAAVKALGLKANQWQGICVAYEENGKPYLAKFPLPKDKKLRRKWKHELSISHDGEYAIANVIFYA